MGGVGDFLFGGSQSDQHGSNMYRSDQRSINQSQQSSANAGASGSANYQKSGSQNYNQAYAPISAALSPALGYTTQAGDAMASLLGLPPSSFTYQQPVQPPLMPSGGNATTTLPGLGSVMGQLTPATPPPPTPTPAPTPTPTPTPGGTTPSSGDPDFWHRLVNVMSGNAGSGGRTQNLILGTTMERRETGGPVAAGQPYIVGEKQPEVFVPHTNGTILPSVPGSTTTVNTQVNPNVNAGSALNNYANSAGLGFVLDQGQKAISGASAGNGVFNSGATGKALVQYGQNLGNTYLNDYLGRLGNYANLGLGAASALTGAGGVNQSQSLGEGTSSSVNAGTSQGTSSGASVGTSFGQGQTSGDSHSKKGLF